MLIAKRFAGADAYCSMYISRQFRRFKRLPIPLEKPWSILSKEPIFPHHPGVFLFLALFPDSFLEKYYWLINPVIDAVTAGIIACGAMALTGKITAVAVTALFYALSVSPAREATNLNSRALGNFLFTLSFLSLLFFSETGSMIWIILFFIFGFFVLVSSKMSTQLIPVAVAALAVTGGRIELLLLLPALFFLTLLITGGYYWKLVKIHLGMIYYWWFNGRYRQSCHPVYESPLYANSIPASYEPGSKDIARSGLRGFYNASVLFVAKNPEIILAPVVFAAWGAISPGIHLAAGFSLMVMACAVLTDIVPYLRGLSNDNYGRFISGPIAIIGGSLIFSIPSSTLWVLLIAILLLQADAYKRLIYSIRMSVPDRDFDEVCGYFKSNPSARVLTFPFSRADSLRYFTGVEVITDPRDIILGPLSTLKEIMRQYYSPVFPVMTVRVEDLVEKYRLTHILIDKNFLKPEVLELDYPIAFELERFLILAVPVNK